MQKGGVKIKISRRQAAYILARMNTDKFIPIPSQKRGICLADAMSSIIWYTDEIRDFLWEFFSRDDTEINTDCDQNAFRLTPDELVRCWLQLTAARIVKIFDENIPTGATSRLRREPSAPLEEVSANVPTMPTEGPADIRALGELCSMVYSAYRKKLVTDISPYALFKELTGSVQRTRDFGIELEHSLTPSLFNSTFQLFGREHLYICSNTRLQGSILLAVAMPMMTAYTVNELNGDFMFEGHHAAALCKINGRWHYLDNNVGFSIPFLDEYNDDNFVRSNRYDVHYEHGNQYNVTIGRTNIMVTETLTLEARRNKTMIIRDEGPIDTVRYFIYRNPPLEPSILAELEVQPPAVLTGRGESYEVNVEQLGDIEYRLTKLIDDTSRNVRRVQTSDWSLRLGPTDEFPVEFVNEEPTNVIQEEPSLPMNGQLTTRKGTESINVRKEGEAFVLTKPNGDTMTVEISYSSPWKLLYEGVSMPVKQKRTGGRKKTHRKSKVSKKTRKH
jgi:hypothetical protein